MSSGQSVCKLCADCGGAIHTKRGLNKHRTHTALLINTLNSILKNSVFVSLVSVYTKHTHIHWLNRVNSILHSLEKRLACVCVNIANLSNAPSTILYRIEIFRNNLELHVQCWSASVTLVCCKVLWLSQLCIECVCGEIARAFLLLICNAKRDLVLYKTDDLKSRKSRSRTIYTAVHTCERIFVDTLGDG